MTSEDIEKIFAKILEPMVAQYFEKLEERLTAIAIDTAITTYLSLSVATAATGIEPAILFSEAEKRGIHRVSKSKNEGRKEE
ncbi:hypothetical protein SBF1_750003 [Candidatus Desulfosporosinus infrequens]|uniref:Uncharacterized protein n=1 Tax=Candidatus Desulfosporosinus infrequens TaxID=2043169 RepID=A0A2U3LR25_9FIRM|nr:hypothetical protein SBF1_750003 [Candidatus Desulfosporosinus infrequens]